MARDFKIQHGPTVAYCPLTNGTVEPLNQYILADIHVVPAEVKLAPQNRTADIDMLPCILNEAP